MGNITLSSSLGAPMWREVLRLPERQARKSSKTINKYSVRVVKIGSHTANAFSNPHNLDRSDQQMHESIHILSTSAATIMHSPCGTVSALLNKEEGYSHPGQEEKHVSVLLDIRTRYPPVTAI